MDVDVISFESMLAAKASADWAFYALFVTSASLVISLITLIIARKALYTWKEQYKEDKKIKLIDTLILFNNKLIIMPKSLGDCEDDTHRKLLIVAMSEVHARCVVYLKDKPNAELSESLELLRDQFEHFLAGQAYKSELALIASKMLMMDLP